jgi:thioesterase domain-containing protein
MEQTVTKASRLEDVARLLVDEIRRKTPTGPYNLGGWCVSGILAYEAAVQLEALGETVSLLALVGSPNPEEYSAISKAERLKSKLLHHWKHIRQLHLTDLSDYLVERAKYRLRTGDAAETSQFSRILLDLALEYKPKPIRARVVLFQSEDRPSIADHASGWGTVVNGRFDVYEVPGNHVTSLQEPNVTVLARRLRACLAH